MKPIALIIVGVIMMIIGLGSLGKQFYNAGETNVELAITQDCQQLGKFRALGRVYTCTALEPK